jgi:hypothetical protein
MVLIIEWKDRRNVTIISAFHNTEVCLELHWVGVDKKDQKLQPFLLQRKKVANSMLSFLRYF